MYYKGIEWTVRRPGLSDNEFKRFIDLDEKEAEGTLTWRDRMEGWRLIRKMRKAHKQECNSKH